MMCAGVVGQANTHCPGDSGGMVVNNFYYFFYPSFWRLFGLTDEINNGCMH